MPPKPDLSFTGLEEFTSEPIVIKHVVENSEAKASEAKPKAKIEKKIVKPSFAKIKFVKSKEQVKSPRKTTVKQGDQNRLNTYSPRGNQRNWNYMMSQRLGSNFEMINKACYRVNTVKDKNVNTAKPKAVVNAAKLKAVVNAARPKAVVNVVKEKNVNVVKASACWVWKPKTKVIDHGNPQHDLQEKGGNLVSKRIERVGENKTEREMCKNRQSNLVSKRIERVDGKKIIITEASVRRDLQLDDEEGMDCLPNVAIFEELTRMGSKTTAWNEFSNTMASAIICLATNQKFNFSKYIFESMVKNLENVS
ncbi:hypothetical protein Tco_1426777, partial [Tanacetum coccineum]